MQEVHFDIYIYIIIYGDDQGGTTIGMAGMEGKRHNFFKSLAP